MSWCAPFGQYAEGRPVRSRAAGQRRRTAWLLLVFALFGITGAVTLFSSRPLR